jgi:glucose-1-phosphate cytidylyltransferase
LPGGGNFWIKRVTLQLVILAGGLGTRISEETSVRPKPMIEIGGMPVLWHIMKLYASHGITDFIVCLGYKGYVIKEYFSNYFLHTSDVTFDLKENKLTVHRSKAEPWEITLVNTGEETMTGGRILRIRPYLKSDDLFCMTYGDGLGDVDVTALVDFARKSGVDATLTAVQPPARFGALNLEGDRVLSFQEKPEGEGGWINGGFFVLKPSTLERIEGDHTVWEREPLEGLASAGQLAAYFHHGFWQPLDTLRDKLALEAMWSSNKAPWRKW